MTTAEQRRQRADDATCAALVALLWRLRAHTRGESPIKASK